MVDATGKVRIFYGINMVDKFPPYDPLVLGFGKIDAEVLATTGIEAAKSNGPFSGSVRPFAECLVSNACLRLGVDHEIRQRSCSRRAACLWWRCARRTKPARATARADPARRTVAVCPRAADAAPVGIRHG